MQAIPFPQAYMEVRGTRLSLRPTYWALNPSWSSWSMFLWVGESCPVKMLRCPVAEEGLGWCQAGISRTDSQTLSCIPGHTGRQRPPCFSSRDLATKEYVCMVQLVSPVQKPLGDGEMAERDSGVCGGLLCRELGREGRDLANQPLHYHHSHLPGNRKKNNLVAIV